MARLVAVVALLALFVLPGTAADLPAVWQPGDPALSGADRAALQAGWKGIEATLQSGYPLGESEMLALGWSDRDHVEFVAGTLASAGYPVLLVSVMTDGGVTRTWILAGVSLSVGVSYVPVEAAPSRFNLPYAMGTIAWQDGERGGEFDEAYLSFTQAEPLAPNAPPTVELELVGGNVHVRLQAMFRATALDPDGAILAYLWAMSDGAGKRGTQRTLWHTFAAEGEATVTVTAVDTRGGRATASVLVDVEPPIECNCDG